jgi:hypothetical protein
MSADGNNYGLNGNFEYSELLVDSFDATQWYSGSSITNWPRILLGKPMENVVAVKVLQATIPYKYYVFNSTNNTFTLNESSGLGGGTVTIPVGTYTTSEFTTILKTALEIPGALTYTVTYSDTTMKFTISSSDASPRDFNLVFTSNPSCAAAMGFSSNPTDNLNFSTTSTTPTLVAPYVAQLEGAPYLYLCSRTLGAMVHVYLNGSGIIDPVNFGADGPQIAMIPMNATTRGQNITYNDPDPQKWFYLGAHNMSRNLDFYLTLGIGNEATPLDLNGARFQVKLGILTSKMQGNDSLPSTRGNHRVVSKTWQAGGNRMEF